MSSRLLPGCLVLGPLATPANPRVRLPWRPLPSKTADRVAASRQPWWSGGRRGLAAAAAAEVTSAGAACTGSSTTTTTSQSATHFKELLIKDFALVEEQRLALQPGLTVITGESGAGKSVLVEALGQILGGSASDEAVRPPATTAILQAAVEVAPADQPALRALLGELGVPQKAARDLGTLVLRRELSKGLDGSIRSRCFVNGSPTSVRALRLIGQLLVDVNGQHAALSLKDPTTRLRLLDRQAGTSAAAERFAALLAEWQQAAAQLRELDALSVEEQRETMQCLVDEVHAAGVEAGEDRWLRQQLRQLDGRRAAAERCRLVSVGLSGDGGGGIADALRDVQLQVKQLVSQEERLSAAAAAEREEAELGSSSSGMRGSGSPTDGADSGRSALRVEEEEEEEGSASSSPSSMLQAAIELLGEAQALLEDAEGRVVQYARLYRFSQAEYDELSGRLQQLERLMKQWDVTSADELLELAEKQGAALDLYFQMAGRRDELEAEASRLLRRVQGEALELSQRRRLASGQLGEAVEAVLADLAMAGSRFDVRMTWTPLSAAAASSAAGRSVASSGELGSSSIGVGADEAAACCEDGGRYRVRPSGLDTAEFLFAAGPVEPLRPLSAVASGGESARIMLALKAAPTFMMAAGGSGGSSGGAAGRAAAAGEAAGTVGSDSSSSASSGDGSPAVMILDEIDSGIGARLGQSIGRILRRLAAPAGGGGVGSQVLCVSHLPQVAAHAEHHLCVRKASGIDKRMLTRFELLQQRPERVAEISAMAGLGPDAAEELLAAAAEA